jgi:hypothetical protein
LLIHYIFNKNNNFLPFLWGNSESRDYASKRTENALSSKAFLAAAATDITPEITELARALRYDPKLIYDAFRVDSIDSDRQVSFGKCHHIIKTISCS